MWEVLGEFLATLRWFVPGNGWHSGIPDPRVWRRGTIGGKIEPHVPIGILIRTSSPFMRRVEVKILRVDLGSHHIQCRMTRRSWAWPTRRNGWGPCLGILVRGGEGGSVYVNVFHLLKDEGSPDYIGICSGFYL